MFQLSCACSHIKFFSVSTPEELKEVYGEFVDTPGPVMLEIKVPIPTWKLILQVNQGGHRKNLGRPTRSPMQNKEDFMEFLDRV
jgi:phosphonopyruvate decarboxylase